MINLNVAVGKVLIAVARKGREIDDSAKLLSNKSAEKSAEKISESAELVTDTCRKGAEKMRDKVSDIAKTYHRDVFEDIEMQ